jgi:putative ABC transport system permease protein
MSRPRIIGVFHDFHDAIRGLKRSPGFTTVAVFTLALGVGATTTLFSVTDGVLLRPLPFKDADRLVVIWQRDRLRNQPFVELSYPAIRAWRDKSQLFVGVAGLSSVNSEVVLTGPGDPIAIEGRWVTGHFFEVLGVDPLLGRVLTPADDQSGAAANVVLSYRLWRDQFGADRAVLGDSIVLGGKSHTIVGVMPDGFDYPRDARFWVSIGLPLRDSSTTKI